MPARLDWQRDGADWPNRASSRMVRAGGLTWHVQVAGSGPVLLLVHGTGASTHSWRDLLPLLATGHTVVARWDAETVTEKLELRIGKDLQYVRINGTLVGFLVGGLVYAVLRATFGHVSF